MVEKKDLDNLVNLREAHAKAKASLVEKMKAFSEENQALMTTEKDLKAAIEKVETTIKAAALEEFKETGSKKLLGGVGIRESAGLEYDDAKAFEYAKEKNICLMLDVKGFEAAAVALKPDFVTVVTTPKATIPKVVKYE